MRAPPDAPPPPAGNRGRGNKSAGRLDGPHGTPTNIADRLHQPTERLTVLAELAAVIAADAEHGVFRAVAAGWPPHLAAEAVVGWWSGSVRAAAEKGAARAVAAEAQ